MKIIPKLSAVTAVLSLFGACAFFASAASAPSGVAPGTFEIMELKVLKVFSANDGNAIFRAYMVEYNGQEVVVSDNLAKTHYRTDDMITVQVMKNPLSARTRVLRAASFHCHHTKSEEFIQALTL